MSDSPVGIVDGVHRAVDRGGWAVIQLADGREMGVRIESVEIAESDGERETRSLAAPFARRSGEYPWMSGVLFASERTPFRWHVWARWLEAGPSAIDDRRARVDAIDPVPESEIVG